MSLSQDGELSGYSNLYRCIQKRVSQAFVRWTHEEKGGVAKYHFKKIESYKNNSNCIFLFSFSFYWEALLPRVDIDALYQMNDERLEGMWWLSTVEYSVSFAGCVTSKLKPKIGLYLSHVWTLTYELQDGVKVQVRKEDMVPLLQDLTDASRIDKLWLSFELWQTVPWIKELKIRIIIGWV